MNKNDIQQAINLFAEAAIRAEKQALILLNFNLDTGILLLNFFHQK